MSNEFVREERHIVFKTSDLGNSLKLSATAKLEKK